MQEAILLPRSSRVTFRTATVSDLKFLINVEDAGSAVEPASLQQLTRWVRTAEAGPRRLRGKKLWTVFQVAECEHRIVAHAVLLGEDDVATLRIIVHPIYRCEGIGSRLLEVTLDAAQGCGLAVVEWIVHERHASTLEFATKSGFKVREVQPVLREWFGPGNDGFALALRVAPPRV